MKPKDVPEPLDQETPAPTRSKPESFWQELKRRKVYSVGSAYLAAAWIAIEATSITFPSLGLPGWAQTLVVALAIAGFPVALLAAWALEVTPEGVQVESDAGFEPLGAVVRRWRASATLRGAVVGGLIVLAAATAASAARWRAQAASAAVRSIVVLPLDNLSGEVDRDFFTDAMTDALISNLAKIESLHVISRNSAMRYKDSELSPSTIARQLGVDGAIEGSVVQSADGRVRITVTLISVDGDQSLWSQSYARQGQEVLALQSEVAQSIANQIQIVLSPQEEARLAEPPPVDTAITNPYYRGRYYLEKRSPDDLLRALDQFEISVARSDSTFAPAYAGVADAYGLLGCCGYDVFPPTEAMPKAAKAARRALQLDEQLAEAHTSAAWVAYTFDWEWSRSEAELRRALSLAPSSSTARMWLSGLLGITGRFDEAIDWSHRAIEADPVLLIVNANLGLQYYNARRYDEAIKHLGRTLDLDPDFAVAILWRGKAHLARGDHAAGLADIRRYALIAGRSDLALAYLAYAEAAAGDLSVAENVARELSERAGGTYISSYAPAVAHLGLGDTDAALGWLERAFVERSHLVIYLGVDAIFDSLRTEPRFRSLLTRIGLPTQLEEV